MHEASQFWHLHTDTSHVCRTEESSHLPAQHPGLLLPSAIPPLPAAPIPSLGFFSCFLPLLSASSHPCTKVSLLPQAQLSIALSHSCPMLPLGSGSRRKPHLSCKCSAPWQWPLNAIIKYQQPPEATRGCVWTSALSWLEQEMPSSVFSPSPGLYTPWALPKC